MVALTAWLPTCWMSFFGTSLLTAGAWRIRRLHNPARGVVRGERPGQRGYAIGFIVFVVLALASMSVITSLELRSRDSS